MICETVRLPYGGKNNATLTLYVPQRIGLSCVKAYPTVLVMPGGGYSGVSSRESECIAVEFISMGMAAAVLSYSVDPDAEFPQSLCEAALAMAYLKENAETYQIDKSRIYTCGFSAGGHLALSLGVFWDKAWLSEAVGKENELLRPTAQILCYPVVSSDPAIAHAGSIRRLMGGEETAEKLDLVSLEKHVSPQTPPTFLWTTQTDKAVPCENSLRLVLALQENKVPTEFHMYGWGGHGLSLCSRITKSIKNLGKPSRLNHINPHAETWLRLAQEWLEEMFGAELIEAEEVTPQ